MLKQNYASPRWSGEILDCSMPMTFDTYNGCYYNCLYCFAFFQKSHCVKGYEGKSINRDIQSVNPKKVKQLFINCLNGNPQNKTEEQFMPYIQDRITMQWGGMADGFDEFERQYGVSLELLKFFDEIDYPLSISTKGVWWTKDKRYMELFRKHKHNWHVKISIITLDSIKSKIIEEFCPSPKERLEAIKRLADNGIYVTLRLRPYIIGLSDDYKQLIRLSAKNGAKSVSTEFFCLERRADEELKAKYKLMSKILGYDIYEFYRKNSKGSGYSRLNYNLKKNIVKDMKKTCHKYKLLFLISDAHHKEKCDHVCCCGCPPNFKVSKAHFNGALQIAKKKGFVKWEDIKEDTYKYYSSIEWISATGFNTGSNKQRSKYEGYSMYDYIKRIWNTPKSLKSPYKYFEGILYPIGLDKDNNVIYKYNTKKARS